MTGLRVRAREPECRRGDWLLFCSPHCLEGGGTVCGQPFAMISRRSRRQRPPFHRYDVPCASLPSFVGAGHVPRDRRRAAQYLSAAAEAGDPAALFWLGTAHHHGDPEAGELGRVHGRTTTAIRRPVS
jgi:hypothetical protein